MKTKDSLYVRILVWAYEKSKTGFTEQELLDKFEIKQGSVEYKLYLRLFKGGNPTSGNASMIEHFDARNEIGYWCLSEKGMAAAIDYLELKETQRSSKQGFWIAVASISIGVLVGVAQILL